MNFQYPETQKEKNDKKRRDKADRKTIREAKERAKTAEENRKKAKDNFKPTTVLRKPKDETN